MANPTTYFGWVMPNSADLVTDLPADFNVFGQGVDTSMQYLLGGTTGQILSKTSGTNMAFTWINNDQGDITGVTAGTGITGGGTSGAVTITNDMATTITTAGDLIKGTGSGTYNRLGIGSTGQVLTVASGAPSWATPAVAASGMTLISRTSPSASATLNFDGVFTSTYASYVVVCEAVGSGSGSTDNMRIKLRYAGPTTATDATYYGNAITTQHYNTTITNTAGSGLVYWTTALQIGSTGLDSSGRAWFQFQGVGNASESVVFFGNHYTTANTQNTMSNGGMVTGRTYTGFQLSTSGGNTVTATVAIYGLAKA
jgi:hypothetical protein